MITAAEIEVSGEEDCPDACFQAETLEALWSASIVRFFFLPSMLSVNFSVAHVQASASFSTCA